MSNGTPAYQLFEIDLSQAAVAREIPVEGQFLAIVGFLDVNGQPDLDGRVDIAFGLDRAMPYVPAYANFRARGSFSRLRMSWAAQSGRRAVVFVSTRSDAAGLFVESPPAKQLVTTSLGAAISVAAVNVATTATQLAAADSARQSCTLFNIDNEVVFIGPSTVTTANGAPLYPGDSLTIDKTTAAIFGISITGSRAVRVMTEA